MIASINLILFPVDLSGGHPHKEGTEPEVKGQEGGKQVAEVFLHLTLLGGFFPLSQHLIQIAIIETGLRSLGGRTWRQMPQQKAMGVFLSAIYI
jgi:hypothetical protein